MPRSLKTYVTSIGFFELAVAAPSMKAALKAWGAERNLFHQGFAKQTDSPAVVAATMAQPGVVLKRAVGSRGAFREQAELPKSLPANKPKQALPPTRRTKAPKQKAPAKVFSLAEARAAKQATAAFEKEQIRREADERKEEAVRARQRARRAAASAKAEAALKKARGRHDGIIQEIETAREALDRRSTAEEARWNKEKEKLEENLRRIRE